MQRMEEDPNVRKMTPERANSLMATGDIFIVAVPCAPNYPARIVEVEQSVKKNPSVTVEHVSGWLEGRKYKLKCASLYEEIPHEEETEGAPGECAKTA